MADGLEISLNSLPPGCVVETPTGGGPKRAKLVFPANPAQDVCFIYGPVTAPSMLDLETVPQRPGFARLTWEQITGASVVAPGACAASPQGCTKFTIAPIWLTEGQSLQTATPEAPVWSDYGASQGTGWKKKYTITFRDILSTSIEVLKAMLVIDPLAVVWGTSAEEIAAPRKALYWRVCRPRTRLENNVAIDNDVFVAHALLLSTALPIKIQQP